MNPENPSVPARIGRRKFLKSSSQAVTATAVMGWPSRAAASSPNSRIVIGMLGPGGMGMNHLNRLAGNPDVEVAAICEVDRNRLESAAGAVEKISGKRPATVDDLRRLLDRPDLDAVFIATPDHWHAPATLLACQAGKHVYVEKPCSHNVREGRLMIEAGRQYDRVIEVAAQSRSARYVKRAIELLHDGAIGEILTAKAWNSQRRRGIGKTQPSEAPSHLDFDAWLGSAPKVEYRGNMLHSVWRWWFDYGAGDFGNDGVHDIDIARWGLNMDSAPVRMAAMGGKYFFDDDQQFPDTQNVLFEYLPEKKTGRPRQLMFEQRIWSPYVQEGHENGNAFYGTDGMMIFGKSRGWKLFGPRNELREEMTGSLDVETHHQDFFDAIRLNRKPSAGIETGHYSATLCHLGNIAVRTSGFLEFDPEKERVLNSPSADGMLSRRYREHWATPAGG